MTDYLDDNDIEHSVKKLDEIKEKAIRYYNI